jgi:hypothetical protein
MIISFNKGGSLWFGARDFDSLGFYKREIATLAQVYRCLLGEEQSTINEMFKLAMAPKLSGFSGFQASAYLMLAEAIYTCRSSYKRFPYSSYYDTDIKLCFNRARESAHNIQDARFCARTTSRCNAMQHRWWKLPASELPFSIDDISETVDRICKNSASPEFAALHRVGEDYSLRTVGPNKLPLPDWLRQVNTLETIAQIYQKSGVELQRFNFDHGWAIDTPLPPGTWVNVPDPDFATLLTGRLSAEILVKPGLSDAERVKLIQALVPLAAANPTVLDTILARLLLAARPNDSTTLDTLDVTLKRYLSQK